jgi:hypothetical protein
MSKSYPGKPLAKIARSLAIAGIPIAALLIGTPTISAADATAQKAASSAGKDDVAPKVTAREARKRQQSDADAWAKAESLVQDALFNEIAGDRENRDRVLKDAQELSADYPPAQWHDGKVMVDGQWLTVDAALKVAANDSRLADYIRRRASSADTELGNVQLADWCASRNLDSQARAHYERALEYNPDNLTARARLDYKQYRGQWISRSDYVQRLADQTRRAKLINEWGPRVVALRNAIFGDNPQLRDAAVKELATIKDRDAVPALERALSVRNQDANILLVNKLAEIDGAESTAAIARQSLFCRSDMVRNLAATKLNGRPLEEYAPQMINALKTPIQVSTRITNVWRPEVWNTYYQESQYGVDALTLGTAYYMNTLPAYNPSTNLVTGGGNASNTTVNRRMLKQDTESQLAWNRHLANVSTNALNERVIDSLQLAAVQPELTSPEQWWDWWDAQTEMQANGPKPIRSVVREREIAVFTDDPYSPEADHSPAVYVSDWHQPVARMSCFTGGTPVTTVSGSQAIEAIKIGDLVLSQSADTGELCFKPVMHTTIRPPVSIFTIETSGTTLHSTGGHLFWVAGEGWTKARNLRSGQTLHCANGTVQVSLVTEEPQPQQTYNLVVADFNTYFVGTERILSHDVTERKPTRSIVPGLARN